jgi:hypothetical protein
MRTFYPAADFPILYKSTYECGDLVDSAGELPADERCVKGYMAQSDLIGGQLLNIVSSFVNSRASLIVEGVHLSVDLMMKIVTQFPNVIPFLIYIKKEAFHQQRFAVRAKYMTTDPTVNRYISHFSAIRTVQSYLSKEASRCLIPKLDNRNIDRSVETMHQTLFSYLKKLEGRSTMFDSESQRLTFLDSVWKRRKQKITSKSKTLKAIKALKKEPDAPQADTALEDVLRILPKDGMRVASEDMVGDVISFCGGTMVLSHEGREPEIKEPEPEPIPRVSVVQQPSEVNDDVDTETEPDPGEVTLTDFMETDSELVDWNAVAGVIPLIRREPSETT